MIGDPIAQSKSPVIHGFWLEQAGIDAEYRATHVTADALAGYIEQRRADENWLGCNVTMPHKQAIIPLLDRLEPLARKVGAVNTVTRAQKMANSSAGTPMSQAFLSRFKHCSRSGIISAWPVSSVPEARRAPS